jgi:hypothetical protein
MPGRGGSANSFGIVTLAVSLTVVLALGTACDVDYRDRPHLATFSPIAEVTPFITTSIFPQAVVVVPFFGFGCSSFATNFDLVIKVFGTSDLFLRETSFRLLDGTTRGSTPLVVSTRDLEGKFGPTLIHAGSSRSFAFAPQFGCGGFSPVSLSADVVLIDSQGVRHDSTVVVPIRGH